MKYTTVGRSNTRISQIGLGTWQFGTKGWGYGKEFGDDDAKNLVHKALELGINLIDTAEVYGSGKSEQLIGEALKDHDRDEFVICTKFMPLSIRASTVKKALFNSLKRLKMDYVDIYLIHWPVPYHPIRRTLRIMEQLAEEGYIRHLGVSNFSLKKFQKAARALGKRPLEVNQLNYSLARSEVEKNFLPFAKENNVTIMAYSPLAQGWLSGKYSPTNRPGGVRRFNRLFRKKNLERGRPLLDALRTIAEKHGTTPSQVALNWLIKDKEVIAIPGAKNIKQLENNAAATSLVLDSDDLKLIDEARAKFKPKLIF